MIRNKLPKLASKKQCTGCMVCSDACPKQAIRMIIGEDGHFYPEVNIEKCVKCHICENVCPVVTEYTYTSSNSANSAFYAAWVNDDSLRLTSTSGGIFAGIAKNILEQGGVVVGAISDGINVRHIIIDNIDNLYKLQGSKYLQSNTEGIYKRVKEILNKGQLVLFSGTGCQVAGLLSFLKSKYNNLVTVDLVCAGVPSHFAIDRFCTEERIKPDMIRWRDKENGWRHSLQISIYNQFNVLKYSPSDCFFGGCFLSGNTNRWSCYNCRFSGLNRKADFTIADFWGIKNYWNIPTFTKEQYKGISLLIVHSDTGYKLLRESNISFYETTLTNAIRQNPRVILGRRYITFERRILPLAFRYFSYKNLKKIYGGTIYNSEILWLPYKIFRFFRYLCISKLLNIRVKTILSKYESNNSNFFKSK